MSLNRLIAIGCLSMGLAFSGAVLGCEEEPEGFDTNGVIEDTEEGMEEMGEGLEETAEETGGVLEESAEETGEGLEEMGDELE